MIPFARRVPWGLARSLAAVLCTVLSSRASFAQPANPAPPAQDAPPGDSVAPTPPPAATAPAYGPPPGYYSPPPYYTYPPPPPPGYAYPPPGTWPAQSPYPPELYGGLPNEPPISAAKARPRDEAPRSFSLGATLATSYESEPGSTSIMMSPLLEGALALHPFVLLDLTWGFSWMVDGQGLGDSTARVGNPMLSGFFRANAGPWRVRAGLGVTAPLAHFPLSPDGRLYEFVYNQTLAMWGMWNEWLWTTDRMAVPAMGRVGYALSGGTVLVAEAALAPVIGVRGGASGTDVLGQLAVEARLPVSATVDLCPRLQTVLLPSTSVDRFQSAAGLRLTLQTQRGRYFAALLLNLDEPLGVFGGLERWGLHFGKELDL